MDNLYRGDIYYIEPYQTEGSEQRAGRPAIIVSNDLANKHSPVVEVVYLTTQPKIDMPTHVIIRSAARESTALCEQITSVAKTRIGDYVSTLTPDELQRINLALLTSLDLTLEPVRDSALAEPANPPPPPTNIGSEKVAAERDIYKSLYENLLTRVLGK